MPHRISSDGFVTCNTLVLATLEVYRKRREKDHEKVQEQNDKGFLKERKDHL